MERTESEQIQWDHRDRTVESRATDRRQLALAHNREPWMTGVDHRLPPIRAQRPKAFDKNPAPPPAGLSWHEASSARRRGSARARCPSRRTPGPAFHASRFQAAIWLGCSSCLVASSATVVWPLIASSATLALNSAENRLRVLMVRSKRCIMAVSSVFWMISNALAVVPWGIPEGIKTPN